MPGKIQPSEKLEKLFRATASSDEDVARKASMQLAKALEIPLRKGIMSGDIVGGIFEEVDFPYGVAVEFPLDFLAPGTEKDFVAYTIPSQGRVPERQVEGDYVTVPTYRVGNMIDCKQQYARDARWDVLARMMSVLEAGFIKKDNDDGWHTLIAAGADRNIMVFDSNANSGQFTKRLVSLGKVVMRRNGGGNSASIMRGKLTDIYQSPETIEDMRNWGVDIVDEFTRREIYTTDDANGDYVNRIFGVNLHAIDELGETQEYQNYFANDLAGALAAGDLELMVGLDLEKNDSFMHPIRQRVQIFEDPLLPRQQRVGWYANAEGGWACLDNRRVLLLSC